MPKKGGSSKTDRCGKSVDSLNVLEKSQNKKMSGKKNYKTQALKEWSQTELGSNYFECDAIQIHKMERKNRYVKIYYLISSSSMDDRLDKDAQVFPSLSRLVAF